MHHQDKPIWDQGIFAMTTMLYHLVASLAAHDPRHVATEWLSCSARLGTEWQPRGWPRSLPLGLPLDQSMSVSFTSAMTRTPLTLTLWAASSNFVALSSNVDRDNSAMQDAPVLVRLGAFGGEYAWATSGVHSHSCLTDTPFVLAAPSPPLSHNNSINSAYCCVLGNS